MAEAGQKAAEHLREITECPICMSVFTDPRILPCIHTFCFECLNRIGEAAQKKPADKMPCPLCRKEFIIPEDGMKVVQKNFFMENLLVYKTTLQEGGNTIICDMCNIRTEGKVSQIPKATTRCLECQDYYCDSCVKVHQFQKVTKDHQMVKIGSDIKSQTKRLVSMKSCTKHIGKPLDYYCSECKKIVCVSCFVESHKSHDCKDVTTLDEEFRQTIKRKTSKTTTWMNEMQLIRNKNGKRKAEFVKEIAEKEEEIHKRNQDLKAMIDRHTKALLEELSVLKSKNLKELETGQDEIDRYCTILGSFEAYCTELTLKGSASDICSSVDELIVRANDLERDNEAFIYRPHKSLKVLFHAADLGDVLLNPCNNFLGKLEGTVLLFPNVGGLYYTSTRPKVLHPAEICCAWSWVRSRHPTDFCWYSFA